MTTKEFLIDQFNSKCDTDGWRTAFEAGAEEKFQQKRSEDDDATWTEIVGLMNAHHAHHGG